MKVLCKLQIDTYADRQNVLYALASAGYVVGVEEIKNTDYSHGIAHYLVVVYVKEEVKPA